MTTTTTTSIRTIEWQGDLDGCVRMIDQTLLPERFEIIDVCDVETMHDAIKRLVVRGAPAIGIAAAMGLVLAVRDHRRLDRPAFIDKLNESADYLNGARPTAVNLFWALERMKRVTSSDPNAAALQLCNLLLDEAKRIRDEDAAMCRAIGQAGLELIPDGAGILTHCNAGGLATAEYGTALAPIFTAHENRRALHVFADETRPLLQGARLTAWELHQAGIDVTVICDSMAAQVMKEGRVNLVITGADRIAANGDTANKIGTYGLALLARAHDIPFYIAAPSSTFDLDAPDGSAIPIEQRDPVEISRGFGKQTVPENVKCYSPAFDVTPAKLIKAIVTERGIISPVNPETIGAAIGR